MLSEKVYVVCISQIELRRKTHLKKCWGSKTVTKVIFLNLFSILVFLLPYLKFTFPVKVSFVNCIAGMQPTDF